VADVPTGKWGTISLTPPQVLDDVRVPINDVTDFMISVLDIALAALNVVKAFTTSYLNPIAALVQAIVDELESLILSFGDIGLYVTGDWNLMQYPYLDLQGGFSEYERRMVARLTDRTDPTRPDVSSTITTLAAFLYLSVEKSDVGRLQSFLDQISRFLNQSDAPKGGLPTPTIKSVLYGNNEATPISFDTLDNQGLTPPNVARVSWTVPPPATGDPMKPFPDLPVQNFLVTVSTLPDGIPLVYDRARGNTDTKEGQSRKVQPREYGQVLDVRGVPIVLHGGGAMLKFEDDLFGWNSALDSGGDIKDGRARVYGVLDPAKNTVIPLDNQLYRNVSSLSGASVTGAPPPGDIYVLFQKTFATTVDKLSLQWVQDEFSIEMSLEDLPFHATIEMVDGKAEVVEVFRPTTYYVRVASANPEAVKEDDAADSGVSPDFFYDLGEDAEHLAHTSGQPFIVNAVKGGVTGPTDDPPLPHIGKFSDPMKLAFPNTNTSDYLEAVKTALAILVLCRVDLTVITSLEDLKPEEELQAAEDGERMLPGVALKATGLEGYRHLLGFLYSDFDDLVKTSGVTPRSFRQDLLNRVERVAQQLYETTGPMPAAELSVVQETEALRTITWSEILSGVRGSSDVVAGHLKKEGDFTILQSLGPGYEGKWTSNDDYGLALNPWCIGWDESVISTLMVLDGEPNTTVFKNRSPHFIEMEAGSRFGNYEPQPFVMASLAQEFLDEQPSGLKMFYEQYIDEEGNIAVEYSAFEYLTSLSELRSVVGSADRSPVFYYNRAFFNNPKQARANNLEISYCRTLLAEYEGGQLMHEAAITLGVAAAAHQRAPQDGAWLSVRLGDVLPSIEGFMDSLANWIRSIETSIRSVADTLEAYIDFIEARIIELQQLIRRINALITSAFSFVFHLPKVAGLILASKGTDGVLSDLVSAENKPSDSPLSYGAGVAIVAPAFPAFLADLFSVTDDPAAGTMASPESVGDIFGIEDIPDEELNPPSDPEPDVL